MRINTPIRAAFVVAVLALAACGGGRPQGMAMLPHGSAHAGATPQMQAMIRQYASAYGVPVTLVHRVVQRESGYDPAARNGPYYGLMQILPQTARTMGFRGEPSDLLDARTNLHYGVKYLRGAWLVSGGNEAEAVKWYARGYYYEAKRKGLLKATGLKG